MQSEIVDIFRRKACRLNGFLQGSRHRCYGKLINFLPIHVNIAKRRICLHQRIIVRTVQTGEHIPLHTVAALIKGKQTIFLIASHHRRSGTISKEHAGTSILPVYDLRKRLRPQNQGCSIKSCLYVCVRDI